MEKNTNQLYRQKYFVDADTVIRYRPPNATTAPKRSAAIIPGRAAAVSAVKVPMNTAPPPSDAQITVQLVREGNSLNGIRIQCPCGRHAEIDMTQRGTSKGQDA